MAGEALILLLLVKLWEKNAATSYEGAEWARESGGMGRLLIAQHRKGVRASEQSFPVNQAISQAQPKTTKVHGTLE